MSDLPKAYNSKDIENQIYRKWEESGFFNPDNLEKAADRYWKAEIFSMMMPPPNATGQLHLGHAMYAIQDLMVRHARMSGKKTLWLPGTDHAAIATQNVVERQILEKEKKTRQQIGREELLRRIDAFVAENRGQIQNQLRKMGFSADWSREKFTLSPELSAAVKTVFKKLYDAGLIYRGERMVNWCPRCGTTLADDEVDFKQTRGYMYYIRYPLKDSDDYLVVATARPETMLGDTAVAFHPQDSRYKKYEGQIVMLPLLNREIPVVADEHIDAEFGTGAMKVTPGHDHNDFEIAQRHDLEIIHLYSADGKIDPQEAADHGFDEYANLTKEEALAQITKELKDRDFIEKTEEIEHRVGFCYRCGTAVEPVVSKQWFINVNKEFQIANDRFQKLLKLEKNTATLKDMMTAAVKSGAIKIVPERFTKTYFEWMKNLQDWNISRQIWYGHRIPVWYCQDCGETIVSLIAPTACPKCQNGRLVQDEDTLDTWFSSGLWTFSTLGYPNETEDLKTFHPVTILATGYDILFFWVARMILMTGFVLEDIPFRTVYLHGLVRDAEGKKMSKSKGNVVSVLEMIEKYGTDALRLSLILGITPGNDLKISEEKIKASRNFINKLWNISRFILTQMQDAEDQQQDDDGPDVSQSSLSIADEWMLERLNAVTASIDKKFAAHDYGSAGEELLKFTWNEAADWYLEIAKIEGGKQTQLKNLLRTLLKLWHPFAPFVTEYAWAQFEAGMLMIEEYPLPADARARQPSVAAVQFKSLQDLVTGLRNVRGEYALSPTPVYASYLAIAKELDWIKEYTPLIERLTRTKLNFEPMDAKKKMPYFLWQGQRVFLIIPNFDIKKEYALTQKQLKDTENLFKKLAAQIKKSAFLKKAPPEVVEKMKIDLIIADNKIHALKAKLKQLK